MAVNEVPGNVVTLEVCMANDNWQRFFRTVAFRNVLDNEVFDSLEISEQM